MNLNDVINFCDFDNDLNKKMAKRFARNLKELREYAQITVKHMSKIMNMPFQSIARYEKGKTEPSISNAFKIASFFRIDLNEFVNFLSNNDIVELFENQIIKDCLFAPNNKEIIRERFPKLDIDKLIENKFK